MINWLIDWMIDLFVIQTRGDSKWRTETAKEHSAASDT